MKHLKPFNESNADEYYQEIELGEYYDRFDWETFTNKEFDEIEKLALSLNTSDYLVIDFDKECEPHSEIVISDKIGAKLKEYDLFRIFKCKDEWYYVRQERTLTNSTFLTSFFYKCDQWEGLINLLKDKF